MGAPVSGSRGGPDGARDDVPPRTSWSSRATLLGVNRWYVAAAAVVIVGVTLAFTIVPFDDGACPTLAGCDAVGAVPRIATIVVTGILALLLAVVGSAGASRSSSSAAHRSR